MIDRMILIGLPRDLPFVKESEKVRSETSASNTAMDISGSDAQ